MRSHKVYNDTDCVRHNIWTICIDVLTVAALISIIYVAVVVASLVQGG